MLENHEPINELRPALLKKGGNSFEFIAKIVKESPGMHRHSVVYYPDLLGPIDKCLFMLIGSFPTIQSCKRMQLNYDGTFMEPMLSAALKPLANILYRQFKILFERSNNLLPKITCVFDCVPITNVSTWASKEESF